MKTKCKHCNGTGEVELELKIKSLEKRKDYFELEVFLYKERKNPKSNSTFTKMFQEFISYWTEMNNGGKKMRFEMEKVFNVERRIETWVKNDEKWNPPAEPKIVSSIKLPHHD